MTWVDNADRGGMTLLNCHGCHAAAEDICAQLGLTMSDLFDEPPRRLRVDQRVGRSPRQRSAGRRRTQGRLPQLLTLRERDPEIEHAWQEVRRYRYSTVEGGLVQEVVREECSRCGLGAHAKKKRFKQTFVGANGTYVSRKPPGFRPVLYNMPELVAALAAGQTAWLFEGEKDAETAAEQVGLAATTNAQGGLNFPASCASVFTDATVNVVLDRDHAGWERGVHLAELLSEVGARVQLLLPATEAVKSDFTDHIEADLWDSEDAFGGLVPVTVEEVATHAAIGAVRAKLSLVEAARDQAIARKERAEQAEAAGSESRRDNEARYARSWAMEAERRYEKLFDTVDVVRRTAVEASTEWASAAVDEAEVLRVQAQTAARYAHEVAALPVPEPLHAPRTEPSDAAPNSEDESTVSTMPAGTHRASGDEVQGGRSSAVSPTYRILDDQLVEIVTTRDGGEFPKLVLGADARIVEMEYLEREDHSLDTDRPELKGRDPALMQDANPPGPEQLSAVIIGYTHPVTGESMRMRISAEEYKDCSWVESLPGPPEYDSRPSGLAKLRDALKAAAAGDIKRTVRHRATGWRRNDSGAWFYVHAGGAIYSDTVRPASVLMTSPLNRYDLPLPSQDPARIREVFLQDSAAMLTRLPARVTAPLLGQIFRSALGPCKFVLLLVGSPGSFKTGVAALGMHHWGELWDRSHPGASMSGQGDTTNALRLKMYSVKDACFFADDVAPTNGWSTAQQTLENFARMVYNGEARSRVTRDGQSVLEGTPPRASAIITSEVTPRPGSGQQRIFPVPLSAAEIELEVLIEMSRTDSRHGRALLMSSFLQWLAGRLPEMQALAREEAELLSGQLRQNSGDVRGSDAVGVLWSGWVVMARFLSDVGALTEDEARRLLDLVSVSLMDAVTASTDPDNPARAGARIRELLQHALRTGIAHVEDIRTGDAPPWPLAARLGWKRSVAGYEGGMPRYREEPRGVKLGFVMVDPGPRDGQEPELVVTKAALEQVLKETASKMADAPQVDLPTAARALHHEGVLVVESRGEHRPPRLTVQRTLHCEGGRRGRMTVLKLWKVIGDDDPDDTFDSDTGPHDGPAPTIQEWLGIPTDTSAGTDTEASDRDVDGEQECRTSRLASEPSPQPGMEDGETASAQPESVAEPHDQAQDLEQDIDTEMRAHRPCEGQYELTLDGSPAAEQTSAPSAAEPQTPEPAVAELVEEPSERPVPAPASEATEPELEPVAVTVQEPPVKVSASTYAAAVAVLDVDGVWMPDGTRKPLPHTLSHVGHVAELAKTLRLGVQSTDYWYEPGQVWVTAAMLDRLGVDLSTVTSEESKQRRTSLEAATHESRFVTDALADGWHIGSTGDRLGSWTRVWRGGEEAKKAAPWVVLIAGIVEDSFDIPVFDESPTPKQLARRLQLFADALKWPFRINAQTTGFDLLFHTKWKQRKEGLFAGSNPVRPARVSMLEPEIAWSRTLTDAEAKRLFVHCYDRGGSHLAAYSGLILPIGSPDHFPDGCEFNASLPGYWRVEVTAAGDLRYPHPLLRRCESAPKQIWTTTPSLEFARDLGHEPEIVEAYLWKQKGKVLVPYYDRLRLARTALDIDDVDAQLARDLAKTVYTRTGGMMGSGTFMVDKKNSADEEVRFKEGYKPEWRHHWIAKACANTLRAVVATGNKTGEYPVAMVDDTIVYVSDNPDPVAAWPGDPEKYGRGLGQFKWEGSARLADYKHEESGRSYFSGRPYTGKAKEELTKQWDPVNGVRL
ncbi:telomere-binding protein [Nocardia sp. NPDC051030]|uniref:telomere-binding protein n=1 Tax=Nocardia sp. NPDC051030 TaxID=3155162 RepID=UPI00342F4E60